jgi:hypothetical protein
LVSWFVFRSQLIETPFTTLVQKYQQCNPVPSSTLQSQIGIQVGNLSLVMPGIIALMMILIALYKKVNHIDIPTAYTSKEKEEALDALVTTLLYVRDGRHLDYLRTKLKPKKESETADEEEKADNFFDNLKHENELLWQLVGSLENDSDISEKIFDLKRQLLEVKKRFKNFSPNGSNLNWESFTKNHLHKQKRSEHSSSVSSMSSNAFELSSMARNLLILCWS